MDPGRPFFLRRKTYMFVAAAILLAAAAGSLTGRFLRLDLPDVARLEDYEPPVMSRVLDRDGGLVATFAEEKRLVLGHGQVPRVFGDALVSAEDSSFWRHPGIDVKGAFRALLADLRQRRAAEGASTLTMQLAGNLFLDRSEKTVRRKLQEVVLALEIERNYSKEEILRLYSNQVHMGHGLYGVEAAARYYFDKTAAELDVGEAATLVGLLPRPATYSPLRNPDLALRRRNLVLGRMVAEGTLDAAEAERIRQLPIVLAQRQGPLDPAPYFTEEVRRWLQTSYGSSGVYKEGLEVRTTVDPRLQAFANVAVESGLRELDKRQGWRRDDVRRVPDDEDPATWTSPDWSEALAIDRIVDAVVTEVEAQRAALRVAAHPVELALDSAEWTRADALGELFAPGDVVRVRLLELDEIGAPTRVELEQRPIVQAALVALDPSTGEVLAMVGGLDFESSEFNRATQARRQAGSAFKTFIYAAALAEGHTLADVILDEPTVFLDRRRPDPYQPENFTNDYYQTVTLRTALEKSANIASVKLLDDIGYTPVLDLARRLGIGETLRPFPSLALGSFELTLLELTAAYGAFANHGVWVEPHFIKEVTDRDGFPLHESQADVRDAVTPQTAYLITRALEGVVDHGTGKRAADLPFSLAGKTGTTDLETDAWFLGFSPTLAVGVWVGFDEPRSLGKNETGARAALPIWKSFVAEALEGTEALEFPIPDGITLVSVDRATGLKAARNELCGESYTEAFVEGTEPTGFCTATRRRQLGLPYTLQRYDLSAGGALMIPEDELRQILDADLDLLLTPDRRAIEVIGGEQPTRFALQILPATGRQPDTRLEQFDVESWLGRDGKPARIVWMD